MHLGAIPVTRRASRSRCGRKKELRGDQNWCLDEAEGRSDLLLGHSKKRGTFRTHHRRQPSLRLLRLAAHLLRATTCFQTDAFSVTEGEGSPQNLLFRIQGVELLQPMSVKKSVMGSRELWYTSRRVNRKTETRRLSMCYIPSRQVLECVLGRSGYPWTLVSRSPIKCGWDCLDLLLGLLQ